MNVIVVKDYEAMSKVGAEIIAKQIKEKPESILGLATGGSPVGTYQNLIKAYQNKEISFKDIKTYNLDEYVGIPQTHPQRYKSQSCSTRNPDATIKMPHIHPGQFHRSDSATSAIHWLENAPRRYHTAMLHR